MSGDNLPQQPSLFGAEEGATAAGSAPGARLSSAAPEPAEPSPEVLALAARLRARWGDRLRLGTSSWHFPGWAGEVWRQPYRDARLSSAGLSAFARHPLLRCVSLDRTFYRALDAAGYAHLAAQVDEGFRFVVKAPASITDAWLRDRGQGGAALAPNPGFLDPEAAWREAWAPAVEGLGERLGALVFQISPLPPAWRQDPQRLIAQLERVWQRLSERRPPGALLALELRDPELLQPALIASLKAHGVRLCLGIHDRMPDVEAQLPALRANWPGDLVCRWNLQRGQRYAEARDAWAPFDRLQQPDPTTRLALARVMHGTLCAGHRVLVTINNKAEGSAPASVRALAEALDALDHPPAAATPEAGARP